MGWPLAIASMASGAGDLTGNLISTGLQYSLSSSEARRQRQWLEKMANTAHQREVRDLRAAGLNPILSATGGSGASTPSAAVAEVPQMSGLFNQQQAISSAISAMSVFADVDRKAAETEQIKTATEMQRFENAFRAGAYDSMVGSKYWRSQVARAESEISSAYGFERNVQNYYDMASRLMGSKPMNHLLDKYEEVAPGAIKKAKEVYDSTLDAYDRGRAAVSSWSSRAFDASFGRAGRVAHHAGAGLAGSRFGRIARDVGTKLKDYGRQVWKYWTK